MNQMSSDQWANGSVGREVVKESQIGSQFSILKGAIGDAHNELSRLECRLSMVMTPCGPPSGSGESGKPEPVVSPMSENIDQMIGELRTLIGRIGDIDRRLEI